MTTGGDTVELAPDEDRPAEPAAASARRVRPATVVGIAVLLVPAAIVLWCGWQRRWTADDGFINLRVVRQIVEGHGPVFNVGDRVETATSPAWVAVLALLDLLTPFRLEWIAAVTSLATTAGALVLSVFGTRRALRGLGATGLFLPLGALVYASLPPAWDFATSGLETGISLLWLAACWWFLCGRLALRPAARTHVAWYVPIVLGLGTLVRPDFLLFSAAFVLALVVLSRPDEVVRVIALALVVPVVTELARMAYYASLVPNTAIAKEASRDYWEQGWRYLVDYTGPYRLFVPLALLLVLGAVCLRGAERRGMRRYLTVSVVVVVSGLFHALYVVRVGGDFMHARLLLPATFVVLLPLSVVVVRGWVTALFALGVGVWAVMAMVSLRPAYSGPAEHAGIFGATDAFNNQIGIGDERLFYRRMSFTENPVTIDDYARRNDWAQAGFAMRDLAAKSAPMLVLGALEAHPTIVPLREGASDRTVVSAEALGLYAYAVGTDVDVIDFHGLADVVASHQHLGKRGRPGHEKFLPDAWSIARYGAADAPLPEGVTAEQVAAARAALACGGLDDLVDHTHGSWSPFDSPGNLIESVRSFGFRFPVNPVAAERKLCS